MLDHPEMSSQALARRLGRTYAAVRRKRAALGRYSGRRPCALCGQRPVWDASARARRMRLCRGCFEEEMRRSDAERAEANRRRQREFKIRRREGAAGVAASPGEPPCPRG